MKFQKWLERRRISYSGVTPMFLGFKVEGVYYSHTYYINTYYDTLAKVKRALGRDLRKGAHEITLSVNGSLLYKGAYQKGMLRSAFKTSKYCS